MACFSPKGLMNRAHAYKAKMQDNQEQGKTDLDFGVNMGLFTYPILMAADILIFLSDLVPVGEDQIQHVEIARDIAQKFNNCYGEIFKMPQFVVQKSKLIPGLDGRKMSKSYGNYIPLFCEEKDLRKVVMKIKTDSLPPEAPKNPDDSLIFTLYKEFANAEEIEALRKRYLEGIGWGHAKEALYEVMNKNLSEPRRIYFELMKDTAAIDKILNEGAEKVREEAQALLTKLRLAVGVR